MNLSTPLLFMILDLSYPFRDSSYWLQLVTRHVNMSPVLRNFKNYGGSIAEKTVQIYGRPWGHACNDMHSAYIYIYNYNIYIHIKLQWRWMDRISINRDMNNSLLACRLIQISNNCVTIGTVLAALWGDESCISGFPSSIYKGDCTTFWPQRFTLKP